MIAEEEIIGTAKQLKSKKPADWNDFDMATFKNPTEGLSKPSRLTSAICQTNQKIFKQNEKSHLNFYFFFNLGTNISHQILLISLQAQFLQIQKNAYIRRSSQNTSEPFVF